MERAERDGGLLLELCAPALSRMGAGRCVSPSVAAGLLEYDKVVGIDWAWLAADGAMTKAPLGGEKTGPNPTDRAKGGRSVRFSARERGPDRLAHDGAHRHDQKLLEPTLTSIPIERPEPTAERPQGAMPRWRL